MYPFMGKFWNFWFLYVINLSATGYNSMYILVHMYSFMALLYTEVHICIHCYTAVYLCTGTRTPGWLAASPTATGPGTQYSITYHMIMQQGGSILHQFECYAFASCLGSLRYNMSNYDFLGVQKIISPLLKIRKK